MRILLASTSYPQSREDWKSVFIRHQVEALARRTDIDLSTWLPPGLLPDNVKSLLRKDDRQWLAQLMTDGGIAHRLRDHPIRGLLAAFSLLRRLKRACRTEEIDVIHMNWLQGLLGLPNNGTPVLVTALGTDMQLLKMPLMRTMLRQKIRQRRTVICPNAEWMVHPLQREFGKVAEIRYVPLGIDRDWFQAQRALTTGGPAHWICVSRLTAAKIGPLFEWGERHFNSGSRKLHLFGPMQESLNVPDWVQYHGPAVQSDLCHYWFPRGTGLLTLSRHSEGRPQVMLEAMAAGLPVLASNLPAHADFVTHGETGWLCDDQDSFLQGLKMMEDPACNTRIGEQARSWAQRSIGDWDQCAARYTATYRSLMDGSPTR